ncbi:hypothetical protein N7G274_007445 [Stereocaulon virgatum]|uniref:Major facilitator superfamily (MFS) profile domain-containing protein n=1 Tax=Stereocaulon virgatum TaxID=373712 RepID=A0ABR4A270_9LECA
MGLRTQLKPQGNEFTNTATAFLKAYLIAEIVNGIALQKVPPAKWLGTNVILWGIATACTAAAKNHRTLLIARISLGIFEAAVAPSLMLISSDWYTKPEATPRFSIWYAGLGVGQIIGGIVSHGFQQVQKSSSFAGWKIMFVALGVITVIIGFATFVLLPDTPMQARFLSEPEKVALLKHFAINQTGIENKHIKIKHVLEILTDVQLWLLVLLTILISTSSGVITTYSVTLINTFRFSPPDSALLNMPSGIVSIASTLIISFSIRYTSYRWAYVIGCCVPGVLGGSLMSFAPKSDRAVQLTGIYLVNTITATLSVIFQWTASNVAGHTKRVISMRSLPEASASVISLVYKLFDRETRQPTSQPK